MNIDRLHVATEDGFVGTALPTSNYRPILHRALRRHLRACHLQQLRSSAAKIGDHARRRIIRAVDRLICELPRDCREAIVRCVLENQSPTEVARKLHWSKAKVHRAMQQGLSLLCRKLAHRGSRVATQTLARLMRDDARAAQLPIVMESGNEQSRRVAGLAAEFLKTSCR